MQKLVVFNHATLDGYFCGANGDISWVNITPEIDAFAADNAVAGGMLLFGRITYELMARFWPTPEGIERDPIVAERMNNLPKVVFSRTLNRVSWNNTRLIKDNMPEEVRKLKLGSGKGMAILGSGSIVSQLAALGLIDEYQIMLNSVVIGKGKTMFEGVKDKVDLKLTSTRVFNNGSILLRYVPAK